MSPFATPFICKTKDLFNKHTAAFANARVEIRPMIAGNMQRQPFYKKYATAMVDLPNTDFIHECGFYAGNYPELSRSDLELFKRCLQH